ncbi:hypothetical protein EYF80_034892 [Liparis tanakae]|uniref:Uncharacterized protein n=1 Tax=Liparis tanakae TaxID=230148 RepID=A0A4Z2GQ77_9TELE|nr:hypothetical protein EYF80_034892 [Liparis tanakae]
MSVNCSSPLLIGLRLHQDALRSVVKGDAGVRRAEAAGLGRGPRRQRLVGARDVGAGRGQRALADRLVDVLHRLEHALAVEPEENRAENRTREHELIVLAYFCSSHSGSTICERRCVISSCWREASPVLRANSSAMVEIWRLDISDGIELRGRDEKLQQLVLQVQLVVQLGHLEEDRFMFMRTDHSTRHERRSSFRDRASPDLFYIITRILSPDSRKYLSVSSICSAVRSSLASGATRGVCSQSSCS